MYSGICGNLELSEWFMIKSKQQPLMSQRNLFKYLFVCESFYRSGLCTHNNTFTLFTVPSHFEYISGLDVEHEAKQKKIENREIMFFLSFLFAFSISSNFGSSCLGLRAILVPHIDCDTKSTEENVEKVLVNGVAEIKCDVASTIDGDQVLLVVWYKNNLPIYR